MPVLKISDENFQRLKKYAEPLVDSADDALGRVLDLVDEHVTKCLVQVRGPASSGSKEEGKSIPVPELSRVVAGPTPTGPEKTVPTSRPQGKRRAAGMLLPRRAYRRPILESLYALGGKAHYEQVLAKVGERLRQDMTDTDKSLRENGRETVWHNRAQFEKHALVQAGLLKAPAESGRGIWELTRAGVAEVKRLLHAGT